MCVRLLCYVYADTNWVTNNGYGFGIQFKLRILYGTNKCFIFISDTKNRTAINMKSSLNTYGYSSCLLFLLISLSYSHTATVRIGSPVKNKKKHEKRVVFIFLSTISTLFFSLNRIVHTVQTKIAHSQDRLQSVFS